MSTTVVMLPDAEIAKLILTDDGVKDYVGDATTTVYGAALALASARFANPSGAYIAGLGHSVEDGEVPTGIVEADSPDALFVEFGTVVRTTEGGANRGSMPAMHILSDAVLQSGLELGPPL